ncbi:AI-2E family transporter [Nakamurella sp. YIM 132087]|uniref:AI-2E family transporter n=1 Tax=Nakamurella alba TaxID=2665158 RepID=A0A7K1FQR3_9ACTN|nr:AI-2E family transporter [Nakamurella alba]MTD15699.1 AI-2E family transporter [Nakamurella alba]
MTPPGDRRHDPEPTGGPADLPADQGTGHAGEHDIDRALDAAMEALSDHDADPAAEAAEVAAAAAGDPVAVAAVARRQRMNGVRGALSTLSARMGAERATRAAEAAENAAEANKRTQAALEREEKLQRRPSQHPFRTGFLGGLGLLLAYVTFLSLDSIRGTLIVISVAALLAIGLDPAVSFLVRHHIRRGFAVTIVFLTLMAALTGAVFAIIPPIVNEVVGFATSVPGYIENLGNNATIKSLDERFHILDQLQNSDIIQNIGSGAASSIVTAGVTAAGILADFFVAMVLSLFFLAGLPKIKAAAWRLAPASRRQRVADLGDKVLKQMGGYLSGATVVALQAGLVAGVFAAAVGLPYPWAIALGAAVLDFLPVIGPIVIGVSMTLIGFTQSITLGIIAGGFYIVQHMFEAYWLYPRVMRRQVDISTGAVVVAIVIGGALLGVTGALLAVPVAAAVQLIVREVVMPMQERH